MSRIGDWLQAYKPAASRRRHLFFASLLWPSVGGTLLIFGVRWTLQAKPPFVGLLIAVALAGGGLKAWFALDRAARRVIDRIVQRGDGQCIGGFFSWRTWLLVILMAVSGRLLRSLPLPLALMGLLYTAVGTALILASRNIWWAWHRAGTET